MNRHICPPRPIGSGISSGIVVDPGGGGTHTTIGAALAAASPGDVVEVRAGTYPESFTIPNGVRVKGTPAAPTPTAIVDEMADAFQQLNAIRDHPLYHDTMAVLQTLRVALQDPGKDRVPLPPTIVRAVDDGSVAIEMRSEFWRLLVSIESNPSESGWSVVSASSLGSRLELGNLDSMLDALEVARALELAKRRNEMPQTLNTATW